MHHERAARADPQRGSRVTLSIDEVLAQARPKTTTVRVCLRGDLLGQHEALERELAEARRLDESENRHAEAPGVARRLQELEAEIDKAQVQFTFEAVGQKAWTDLGAEHPPTEADREVGLEFNGRTFPVAAIAASAVEPKMSVEQAQQLFTRLNFGQWRVLWGGCLAANVEGTDVPFSAAASAVLRGSEMKSERPTTTGLLEASSSVG